MLAFTAAGRRIERLAARALRAAAEAQGGAKRHAAGRVAAGAIVRIVLASVVARQDAFAAAAFLVGVAAEMAGAELVRRAAIPGLFASDDAAGIAADIVATILEAVAAVDAAAEFAVGALRAAGQRLGVADLALAAPGDIGPAMAAFADAALGPACRAVGGRHARAFGLPGADLTRLTGMTIVDRGA
jgi:hypothetical protein